MYDNFMRNINLRNPAKNTVHNLKVVLESASKYIGKPLENAEWIDILGYFEHMREEEYKEGTINMHKQKLKQFYLFCFDETDDVKYRKIAKKLSITKVHNNLSPLDIVYPDEVKRLINIAMLERDRCVIAALFESGMRVGELINLRIKDVQLNEEKQEVTFHIPEMPGCKTGARSVLCLEIFVYVQDWLKCHPNPAPTEKFMPITDWTVRAITKRAYGLARIDKPNHPHMLRHSSITNAVAIGMRETEIKYRYWGNIGSVMLSTYVHLNEQITANGYRNAKGMNGEDTKVINPLAARCVECGRQIQSGSLCKQCFDIKNLREENKKIAALFNDTRDENAGLYSQISGLESALGEVTELKKAVKAQQEWMQKYIMEHPKEFLKDEEEPDSKTNK